MAEPETEIVIGLVALYLSEKSISPHEQIVQAVRDAHEINMQIPSYKWAPIADTIFTLAQTATELLQQRFHAGGTPTS